MASNSWGKVSSSREAGVTKLDSSLKNLSPSRNHLRTCYKMGDGVLQCGSMEVRVTGVPRWHPWEGQTQLTGAVCEVPGPYQAAAQCPGFSLAIWAHASPAGTNTPMLDQCSPKAERERTNKEYKRGRKISNTRK